MSLQRVRKLFALAADQQGTPEGEAAARIARRLVHERNIELQRMTEEEQERADPFLRQELLLGGPAQWRCRLFSAVALHCGCVASYKPGSGRGWLYGRKASVEVGEHLYVVLSRALTQERVVYLMSRSQSLGDLERDQAANNFCQSAILALESRMQQQREQEKAEAPERLALIVRRSEGVYDWMQRQGHRPRRGVPFGFSLSEEGYAAGWRLPLRDAVEEGA